jgi:hypothetical protein
MPAIRIGERFSGAVLLMNRRLPENGSPSKDQFRGVIEQLRFKVIDLRRLPATIDQSLGVPRLEARPSRAATERSPVVYSCTFPRQPVDRASRIMPPDRVQ